MVRTPEAILSAARARSPDLYRGTERRSFVRAVAARVLGQLRNQAPEEIARRAWREEVPPLTRAPVSPLTGPQSFSRITTSNLLLVAPQSAAAQLFSHCAQLDFSNVYSIQVPRAASHATPLWAGEGLPIAVVRSPTASTTVGPVKKLAFITTFSRELQDSTPENLAVVLGRLLGEAAAKALDAAVFSAVAADATRPAGLLAGVTPLTASTTGATTADSAAADISAFAQAMSDSAINPDGMHVITSPKSATNLRMAMGYQVAPLPILMSPAVPVGTAIAVAPEAVACGTEGEPEIVVTDQPALHFDDSVPMDIVTGGGVVASPTMSSWQKGMVAVRLMVRCTWASVQPGAIQFASGIKW